MEISELSDTIAQRSITFCSWRTFPGQEYVRSRSNAPLEAAMGLGATTDTVEI
jgi:hypothetical protein